MQKDLDTSSNEITAHHSLPSISPGEIIIGTLTGIDEQGRPLVNYPENPQAIPQAAVSTLSIQHKHIGRQIALLFANGNPSTPVIMGLIHSPLHDVITNTEVELETNNTPEPEQNALAKVDDVYIDGKRIVLEGREEIVLKCGEASITLTRAGKIVIRGKYLMNRSTGVNRIMGGSVQIN